MTPGTVECWPGCQINVLLKDVMNHELEDNSIEGFWLEIRSNNNKLLLCTIFFINFMYT